MDGIPRLTTLGGFEVERFMSGDTYVFMKGRSPWHESVGIESNVFSRLTGLVTGWLDDPLIETVFSPPPVRRFGHVAVDQKECP